MYRIAQMIAGAWKIVETGIHCRERAETLAEEMGSDRHPTRVLNEREAILWEFGKDLATK